MTFGRLTDMIFHNYGRYINEHSELKKPEAAVQMLTDDSKYNHFISSIVEGADQEQIAAAKLVCDRQREFLLEESTNIMASDGAIGYAVTYFPILCDIYMDDILGKSITHFPYDKPVITIPHMQLQAKVENSDGSEKVWKFPRAQYLIRSKPETITLIPKHRNDLFKMSVGYPNKINTELSSINKRYFIIEEVFITGHNSTLDDTTSLVEQVSLRPDARGQLSKDFEVLHNDEIINGNIIGHVNWDTGVLQYNVVLTNGQPGYEYTIDHMTANVVFSAKKGDVGRVKVSLKNEGWDVNIDVHDDFEYELDVETIQDYEDIYKVDLVKTMSLAIKNQTLLNRDHDIAHLLRANESNMKSIRNYEKINLQPYRDTMGWLSPGFISTLFQVIIPRISIVNRYIFQNYRARPQFLLTGVKTAAILENLQEYAVTIPTMRHGMAGFDSMHGMSVHLKSFASQIILTSPAIDDNKIYHLYKPETIDELRYTVLVNFIYKPLYVVEEITNSMKRTFVRTRTAMELTSPEATGVTIVEGMSDILSMWGDENYLPNT